LCRCVPINLARSRSCGVFCSFLDRLCPSTAGGIRWYFRWYLGRCRPPPTGDTTMPLTDDCPPHGPRAICIPGRKVETSSNERSGNQRSTTPARV
jgi:hypothetical protein